MRRIVLHLGPKKTATSTIQAALAGNRANLANAGILYPGTGPNHAIELSARFRDQISEHQRARRLTEDPELSPFSDANLAAFDAEVRGGSWHTLLLSAESLYELDVHELDRLRTWLVQFDATIELAITLRDPVDWAVSAAQQCFKSNADIDGLLTEPTRLHWRRTVERIETVFPGARLHLLCFEDLVADPAGPVAAFLAGIDLAAAVALLAPVRARRNESLSWEAAMMMAALNARRPFFLGDTRNPARTGRELSAFLDLAGQRFDLPEATRHAVYHLSRDDVAWLRERFGIDHYDYPLDRLRPSLAPAGFSPAFMAALGDRLADLANELRITRALLAIERLRARGDAAAAERLRRKSHAKFPAERRFAPRGEDHTSGSPIARTVVT